MSLVKAFRGSKKPLLAAYDKEKLTPITLTKAVCPKTGVKFLTNASARPISPFSKTPCFLLKTAEASTQEVLSVEAQKSLTGVGSCVTCSSSFLSTSDVSDALKENGFVCPVCASFVVPSVKDNETALESNGKKLEEKFKKESKKDEKKVEAAADEDLMSEENIKSDEDVLHEPSETKRDLGEMDEEKSEEFEPLDESPSPTSEELMDHNGGDNLHDANEGLELHASLTDVLKNDVSSMSVSPSSDDETMYIFFDNKPVAYINKMDLKDDLHDLFSDVKKFGEVLKIALTNNMEDAIKDFAMNEISVNVPVDEAVAVHLASVEKEMQENHDAKCSQLMETVRHSIAIASMCVNKEFDSETKNPLKEELVKQMVLCGVSDAESVVNSCFAKAMDSYTKTVIAKAFELSDKSDEVRNEVARLVSCASYRSGEASGVKAASQVTAKLASPMKEVTASVEESKADNDFQSLRRKIRLGF